MVIKGKHREILIELLMYHLANSIYGMNEEFFTGEINNIKEQNNDGQWYINYYINNWGSYTSSTQNNNPLQNNDGDMQT
jgi:hypothetical protein